MVRPEGLEPPAYRFEGSKKRRWIAADLGKTGSAVPHLSRPQPVVVAFPGIRCTAVAHGAAAALDSIPEQPLSRCQRAVCDGRPLQRKVQPGRNSDRADDILVRLRHDHPVVTHRGDGECPRSPRATRRFAKIVNADVPVPGACAQPTDRGQDPATAHPLTRRSSCSSGARQISHT